MAFGRRNAAPAPQPVHTTEQPIDTPPPAPARPSYKPQFQARVKTLDANQVKEDSVLRCQPPGVPPLALTLTVDVPPGASVESIEIPGASSRMTWAGCRSSGLRIQPR